MRRGLSAIRAVRKLTAPLLCQGVPELKRRGPWAPRRFESKTLAEHSQSTSDRSIATLSTSRSVLGVLERALDGTRLHATDGYSLMQAQGADLSALLAAA